MQENTSGQAPLLSESKPGGLRSQDIAAIEQALKKVGAFGEVHLVIERGRLRFVRTLKSETVDAFYPKQSEG
jgi:hypothetical protein